MNSELNRVRDDETSHHRRAGTRLFGGGRGGEIPADIGEDAATPGVCGPVPATAGNDTWNPAVELARRPVLDAVRGDEIALRPGQRWTTEVNGTPTKDN
jgi:hypothetical protein